MTMGERITHAREAKGLERKDLAKKIGVSVQTVGNWENDTVKGVRPAHMLTLLEILGVTLAHIVRGDHKLTDTELGDLSQQDVDAVLAQRALRVAGKTEVLEAIWSIIHDSLMSADESLAQALGPRNTAKQREIESTLVAESEKRRPKK